uniref:Uncharacterized protein n=1 Tax=Rhipicephalus zambeziensis TaxID=60191 RepID=A0A224YKB7_9ACAR
MTSQISVSFSYFGSIGTTEFPETWYVKSTAPTENNVLHFYRLGTTHDLVDFIKTFGVVAFGAETSKWHCHPHFLFTRSPHLPKVFSR